MSEFKVGDYVKVIKTEEDDLGVADYITTIDEDGLICVGDEDLPYPLGCWHTAAELAPAQPATADAGAIERERLENYRAIFHDVIAGHLTSTPQVIAEHGLYVLEQHDIQRVAHHMNAERGNDFEAECERLQAKLAAAEARADAAVAAGYVWKQAAKTHRKFGLQMAQRVEDAEQGWHDEVTSKYE